MKDRIKWMLAGLGFTFGLQVIISLIFIAVAYSAAQSEAGLGQGTIPLFVLGIALGAFFVGAFIIGWMSEELRIIDALAVAVVTLIISALVYMALPQGNKGQFVTGILMGDETEQIALSGRTFLFIGLSLAAAAAGAYSGWHVKVPQEGVFDRVILLIGLVGAVVGPFLLLTLTGGDSGSGQPALPWYFMVIVLVLLLVLIAIGFVMFTRESHYDEEISISPDHHKEA